MELNVRTGIIGGRGHIVYGINCQDSLQTESLERKEGSYHFGVVADGCGEGRKSETGAHLGTGFLITKIESYIKSNTPVNKIPSKLYQDLLMFLETVASNYENVDSPAKQIDFIKNHLLFTVLGFIIGPKNTIIFASGDGVVLLNDLIDIRDENNTPTYPAYHIVKDEYLTKPRTSLPKSFEEYKVKTKELKRLAVATDAWEEEMLLFLSLLGENSKDNIQRKMNLLSSREKRFFDDAAIIAVNKKN